MTNVSVHVTYFVLLPDIRIHCCVNNWFVVDNCRTEVVHTLVTSAERERGMCVEYKIQPCVVVLELKQN